MSELITWFRWHNGAGQAGVGLPSRAIEIVPGGEFYWLEYLCQECRKVRNTTSQLRLRPWYDITEDEIWRPTWFPLLRLFGKGLLAVDLHSDEEIATPVHVVWWDSDPSETARAEWPSIAAFIETAIERFDDGTILLDDDGYVDGPTVDHLRR